MGTSEPHSRREAERERGLKEALKFLFLRRPWPPKPANKNGPTSCHPKGIT